MWGKDWAEYPGHQRFVGHIITFMPGRLNVPATFCARKRPRYGPNLFCCQLKAPILILRDYCTSKFSEYVVRGGSLNGSKEADCARKLCANVTTSLNIQSKNDHTVARPFISQAARKTLLRYEPDKNGKKSKGKPSILGIVKPCQRKSKRNIWLGAGGEKGVLPTVGAGRFRGN